MQFSLGVQKFVLGWRNACELQSLDLAHVVVAHSDAVVVCVADVYFHVLSLLVVHRTGSLRLVESSFTCLSVSDAHVRGMAAAKPRVALVSERIHNFYLVIVGVANNHNVLLGDKMHT